jgi:hypothetical protein
LSFLEVCNGLRSLAETFIDLKVPLMQNIIFKSFLFCFQLFGRLQRAWVPAKNLLKFEGVKSFQARAENAKLYQGFLKGKLHRAFNPSGAAKIQWEKSLKGN